MANAGQFGVVDIRRVVQEREARTESEVALGSEARFARGGYGSALSTLESLELVAGAALLSSTPFRIYARLLVDIARQDGRQPQQHFIFRPLVASLFVSLHISVPRVPFSFGVAPPWCRTRRLRKERLRRTIRLF